MDEPPLSKVRDCRLRTVRRHLDAIRAELTELGILDDLDAIEKHYAVAKSVSARVQETDRVLSEVEAVKLAAEQISTLSGRAINALADNTDGLDVVTWLAQARAVSAIADLAEKALLKKARRQELPKIQLWLIGEKLPNLYKKVYGEEFPAGSRTGPGIRFINKCMYYIGFSKIESELLGLRWEDDVPDELLCDPRPIPGETIKTHAMMAKQEAEKP